MKDAKLIVVKGNVSRKEIQLKRFPFTVGRTRQASLPIGHGLVSREHCEIYQLENALVIRDNDSANGTFVNKVQVVEEVLKPGDKVTIGPLTFVIIYPHPKVYPSLYDDADSEALEFEYDNDEAGIYVDEDDDDSTLGFLDTEEASEVSEYSKLDELEEVEVQKVSTPAAELDDEDDDDSYAQGIESLESFRKPLEKEKEPVAEEEDSEIEVEEKSDASIEINPDDLIEDESIIDISPEDLLEGETLEAKPQKITSKGQGKKATQKKSLAEGSKDESTKPTSDYSEETSSIEELIGDVSPDESVIAQQDVISADDLESMLDELESNAGSRNPEDSDSEFADHGGNIFDFSDSESGDVL